jgi:hypothetical protein
MQRKIRGEMTQSAVPKAGAKLGRSNRRAISSRRSVFNAIQTYFSESLLKTAIFKQQRFFKKNTDK